MNRLDHTYKRPEYATWRKNDSIQITFKRKRRKSHEIWVGTILNILKTSNLTEENALN